MNVTQGSALLFALAAVPLAVESIRSGQWSLWSLWLLVHIGIEAVNTGTFLLAGSMR